MAAALYFERLGMPDSLPSPIATADRRVIRPLLYSFAYTILLGEVAAVRSRGLDAGIGCPIATP